MSDSESDVEDLPRFFKVFLSQTASESMAIPSSFTEHLADPLPQTAKLQGTGGNTWTVSWSKIRGRAYFTTGWSKFAEDHELTDGEFMTFVYDGHHKFEVSVFGRCSCKEDRAVIESVELSDSEEEGGGGAVGADDDTMMEASGDDDDDSTFVVSEATETDSGVIVGMPNLDVVGTPYFNTHLKNKTYELLIPAHVIHVYGLRFGEAIIYLDGEGSMVGNKGKWKDDRISFRGWERICRRNRIREEDTVRCDLLATEGLVHSVKVSVTRG